MNETVTIHRLRWPEVKGPWVGCVRLCVGAYMHELQDVHFYLQKVYFVCLYEAPAWATTVFGLS
jgi:hypothetical protein